MAITKILNIKSQSNLYNAIDYIMKPEKTKEQLWFGGNSSSTTQEVYRKLVYQTRYQSYQDLVKLKNNL